MYTHEEFPKWKYHDTETAVIVQNEGEEAALGDGWRDTLVAPDATEEGEAPKKRGRPKKDEE